jgi:tellurite resistance protein
MTDTPPQLSKDRRPRMYPAPEFPPRKPKIFARTPPAIFPSLLGILGLGLALRQGAKVLGAEESVFAGLIEAALGAALILWLLAIIALGAKYLRRFGALVEDMRVLPGRAGLAAATMSGMAAAAVLVPYAPQVALWLVVASLVLHLVMAIVLIDTLRRLSVEARAVNPAMHLAFVGFIVGAVPLALLGYAGGAELILWVTMPIAASIWAISVWQLTRMIPPAPLRPLLAIHLAPAALFSTVAGLVGQPALALGFAALGMVVFLALLAGAKWITITGFSPLWGSFTFPLAAFATALLSLGGSWELPGIVVLTLALGVVPAIGWNVLKLWPGNRLATKTNAAEA